MTEAVTVLERVEGALRRTYSFDRTDRVPPAALLWFDKRSEWRPVVARLAATLPIVSLGAYDGERSGPAIWIRCVVDRTVGSAPDDGIPIVYLPGYERADLREVESCPRELQPLAELQYRGALFGSRAGRDWTLTAFFSNRDEGLSIEIARGDDNERAFLQALPILLDEPVEPLRQKAPLRAVELGALLEPDPVKRLLDWINNPTSLEALDEGKREELVRVARRDYKLDPAADGPIAAAEELGARAGIWKNVWDRFAENPRRYPGVIDRLRQARPQGVLVVEHRESWPQENEDAENELRAAFLTLRDRSADEVRAQISQLQELHGERRTWVWAELEQAPLAHALGHLAALATETERQLAGETPAEIADAYSSSGWKVDAAALGALETAASGADRQAVEGVVAALYRPWADACARRFQAAVISHGTAGFGATPAAAAAGECVLFTDGLRFDLGARLATLLEERELAVERGWQLAALPSLTATAKPAVSLAAARLSGGDGFGTMVAATGQAVTAGILRHAIASEGVTVVADSAVAEPGASGWAEFGNIDAIGHAQTDRFAQDVAGHVSDIADRIVALLESGWQTVRVVTDHGWLYVPGGLEKANLPEHLTVTRKGRAARLRDDAGSVEHPVVPWRWDPSVRVAVAPGLSCYFAGRAYEHGGLSPQECVTPVLTVRATQAPLAAAIEQATWAGMRVRVAVRAAPPGARLDVRTKAAAASTSRLDAPIDVAGGHATALVPDPDAVGEAAFIVLIGADGALLAQRPTTIGGET